MQPSTTFQIFMTKASGQFMFLKKRKPQRLVVDDHLEQKGAKHQPIWLHLAILAKGFHSRNVGDTPQPRETKKKIDSFADNLNGSGFNLGRDKTKQKLIVSILKLEKGSFAAPIKKVKAVGRTAIKC